MAWSRVAAQVAAVAVVVSAMVGGGRCMTNVAPGKNITATYGDEWLDAKATWYGKPTGSGPDDNGGACGYKDVDKEPFKGMIACGNQPIFKDGLGCGSCFEIKCDKPAECSNEPVTVFITDMNYEKIAPYHFDLSGIAFGAMAKKGEEEKLRKAGELELKFRRVKCKYPGDTKITFHIEKGSNPNYIAILVKYVAGDGDITGVGIKGKDAKEFEPMKQSWGAIWRIDTPKPLEGPLSLELTTEGGTKLVADDVIPKDWKADSVIKSDLQAKE
ncbi:hypothetical protein ACP70R_050384 [Stipagrostis hirtigluma subsp. patula]